MENLSFKTGVWTILRYETSVDSINISCPPSGPEQISKTGRVTYRLNGGRKDDGQGFTREGLLLTTRIEFVDY
jgi:hypothetical protein